MEQQWREAEYKYQPEVNKAEYYLGTFNKGKDVEDLVDWYGKFAKWADGKGDVYDSMTVAILQPYFHSNLKVSFSCQVSTKKSIQVVRNYFQIYAFDILH